MDEGYNRSLPFHGDLSVSGIEVSEVKALPCPFCGLRPDTESEDFIYRATRSGDVWSIHCHETWGGCSASILGDSPEDVLRKWNRRKDLTSELKDGVIFPGYRVSLKDEEKKDWLSILNHHPWR